MLFAFVGASREGKDGAKSAWKGCQPGVLVCTAFAKPQWNHCPTQVAAVVVAVPFLSTYYASGSREIA